MRIERLIDETPITYDSFLNQLYCEKKGEEIFIELLLNKKTLNDFISTIVKNCLQDKKVCFTYQRQILTPTEMEELLGVDDFYDVMAELESQLIYHSLVERSTRYYISTLQTLSDSSRSEKWRNMNFMQKLQFINFPEYEIKRDLSLFIGFNPLRPNG